MWIHKLHYNNIFHPRILMQKLAPALSVLECICNTLVEKFSMLVCNIKMSAKEISTREAPVYARNSIYLT